MAGHADTITSLRIDPRGEYILSNSMDSTVRIWDIRPYFDASNGQSRCVKLFIGAIHNMDKNLLRAAWSGDGSYVAAGAADKCVYVWDVTSRQIKYRLPGHNGSVNDVDFHPTEPILASGAGDRRVFLGELEME
jgi:Prp8 binding protein